MWFGLKYLDSLLGFKFFDGFDADISTGVITLGRHHKVILKECFWRMKSATDLLFWNIW